MKQTTCIAVFSIAMVIFVMLPSAEGVVAVRSSSRTSVSRSTTVSRSATVSGSGGSATVSRSATVSSGGAYVHRGVAVAAPVPAYRPSTVVVARPAVVVGTVVYTPPPSYTVVRVGGVTYYQSGTVWYQPQFVGTTTTYVVVSAPQ